MTLIEMMVVVLIIALVSTGVFLGIGAVTGSGLKSGCMRILAASRFAYARSVTQGTTTRVVLDMSEHTIAIEEARGRITLARSDDERREASDESEGDRAAVDPWEAARSRLEDTLRPNLGTSPFGPVLGPEGESLTRCRPQAVADNVEIVRLIVPHEPVPRTSGQGSIYFFPGGTTEPAVVHLASRGTVYAVELNAMTARGRVYDYAYEPEPIGERPSDREQSDVEDRL